MVLVLTFEQWSSNKSEPPFSNNTFC